MTNWFSLHKQVYEEIDFTESVGSELLANKLQTKMTNVKRHLISAGVTFVSTFLLVFAVAVGSDGFVFSKASLYALGGSAAVAGVRAVAKIVVEWFTIK